jgi:hypothetical protein
LKILLLIVGIDAELIIEISYEVVGGHIHITQAMNIKDV